MTQDDVLLVKDAGIARITLNRPLQLNALSLDLLRSLLAITTACAADPAVRVVLLTGAGDKAFCAGGDMVGFAEAGERLAETAMDMTDNLHAAISRLARLGAPFIVAVNGVAAGAGLGLVAAADLAITADHAVFTSAYTKAGLTPDGSTTYHLVRILGARRAAEMILTNRKLTAAEALSWGLVNKVVPGADLEAEALCLAASLATGPRDAQAAVKALLRSAMDDQLETQLDREARAIAAALAGPEGREGVRAFIEKRRPQFS